MREVSDGFVCAASSAFLRSFSSMWVSFCLCALLAFANILDSNLAFSRMDSKSACCPTDVGSLKRSNQLSCPAVLLLLGFLNVLLCGHVCIVGYL